MIKDRFKDWPEEKKKIFSLMVAGAVTLAIVITWFSFNPIFGTKKVGDETQADSTDYLGESLKKISEQYNSVIDQISNLKASSSISTSSTQSGTSTIQ